VRLGSIRKSEVVDFGRLAVISNCTRCRLEIGALGRSSGWGNAGKHARRGRRKALRTRRVLDLGRHGVGIRKAQAERQAMRRGAFKLWCLVTIRKSDLVDFGWLAVISNCTRCRLEIVEVVHGRPARQAIPRCVGARRDDVPGVRRPAALGVRPERRMGVQFGVELSPEYVTI
jgi:hypothetical protein